MRLSRLVCWDAASDHVYGQKTTRLTSTFTVSIHVQDRNDNAPIFTQSAFTAELEENSEIRKEIMQVCVCVYVQRNSRMEGF